MRFITIAFAVAGRLVALATAKPVPSWKADGIAIPLTRHFSSNKNIDLRDAISSHGISVEERILSGLDNYEMNTRTMHPFAVKQSESGFGKRGASLSIPLTNYQNLMWSGEISIGTPPKTLKVHIDTGAANMWVLETGCSGIYADRELWDPNSSESAKKQQPFQFKYSDGSIVTGDRYTDNVTIAGFTADPQNFGSVTSYTSRLQHNGYAVGLLGLAFPSISQFPDAYPLLVSLVQQKRLTNPTFSLKLSSSGAEMYFGGVNRMLYNGDIAYTRVTNTGFWQVSMDDVRVNGNKIIENIPAVFDTGANYIFGNWEQVSDLYGRIGGRVDENNGYGIYYLRCDSFPTVSFTFGGTTFEIPPEALKLRQVCEGSPYCFSAIVGQRSLRPFWSIGMPFLQGVYSVFDYGSSQVGLAKLA